jgi:hypothetical protein
LQITIAEARRLAERTMMAADEHIVRMRQAAAELPVT